VQDFFYSVICKTRVAVKLAPEGYLFLSSMYALTPAKVPKRLKSGRLVAVPKNKT